MYTYTELHYLQDTNNPVESLISLLKTKNKNGQAIRSSKLFDMVHKFLKLTLKRMKERREALGMLSLHIIIYIINITHSPNPSEVYQCRCTSN